jgi:Ni/Fe-hydrogenase subunit HybB-like protein
MPPMPLSSPPWHDALAVYFVVIGLASGVTLVRDLVDLDSDPRSRVVELWATYVSLAALSVAGVILIVDLGRPLRFWLMLAGLPNALSPMAWGARLLALKGLLLLLDAYLLRKMAAANAAASIVAEFATPPTRAIFVTVRVLLRATSLALAIYPAFLLSRTWLSPLARTPASALLFLITTLLLGVSAWLFLAHWLPQPRVKERLLRVMNALLLLELAALGFQWLSIRSDVPASLLRQLLQSRAALLCELAVAAGLLLPALSLLLRGHLRHLAAINAAAIAVGAVGVRYLLFAGR